MREERESGEGEACESRDVAFWHYEAYGALDVGCCLLTCMGLTPPPSNGCPRVCLPSRQTRATKPFPRVSLSQRHGHSMSFADRPLLLETFGTGTHAPSSARFSTLPSVPARYSRWSTNPECQTRRACVSFRTGLGCALDASRGSPKLRLRDVMLPNHCLKTLAGHLLHSQ